MSATHSRTRKIPAPLLSGVVLLLSVTLLIAVGAWYVQSDAPHADATLHLTQVDWQDSDGRNFNPPPALVDSTTLPPSWRQASLPSALPVAALAAPDLTVRTTWMRFALADLHLPDTPTGPLALYGSRIKTDGTVAVYLNGRLVHRVQQRGQLWNSLFTPLWVLPDQAADGAPLKEILIRVEHAPETPVGLSTLWLGPAETLQGRYYLRQWLQRELPATLSAAFMVVGIFALFVWFRRRHETSYLLFFNLAAVSFVGHLHYYVSLPIVVDWFAWLTANALFWLLTVIHLFLCQLHGRPLRRLTRVIVGTTLIISILSLPVLGVLPVFPSTSLLVPLAYAIAVAMGIAVSVAGGICSWNRSREGSLLTLGVAVSTLLGMSDWLLHNNVVSPEGWFLGAYTNAVTFAMFGTLMYRRYVNAIAEVELVNAGLAQRLEARERELEQTHRRLREAAQRQTISDERQRLMQDMHDGLGSTLISAIRSVEHGGASDVNVSQILKDCLDDLKLTIDSMEPVEADLLLLLATLRFRLEPRLEGTDIALVWEVQELPTLDWLEPSSALHILRIVQESIANILRHTRADRIRVATARADGGVTVTIEDNGQGFDVDKALAKASGRGLQNQRRRAQALGGAVTWVPASGGTRFTLWLPLERKDRSA
ncbi:MULTISPECIES: sensor histidine kinase [unclassified Herbaspirillum]|uniref:sensor histidine kinase n=1 Tax=unclassified Herbaspirillum TaxID=2624150 RepID=UPI000E2F0662|nr:MULTISPECIES: sensor histidine kinase [unclassified Herbaspirillum]RFB69944.1 sensor histidine kinase [Herbaspirillum sp. 3R-3a1]TFI06989.1 sensor histidine kinase [Herbaspirillum sp. 3R11]TFI12927.1 sensor histidine kinase [Herbaspirillum sp. 3R-11]TFI21051.1 sensor histidine kinase [Herbaspirillum sp. 3C11]